jgi:hypothetical protein
LSRMLRWALVVCCICAAIALGAAAWYRLSQPIVLTVAVGPADFDDAALISAFARKFVAGGSPVRLSIVPTSGPTDAPLSRAINYIDHLIAERRALLLSGHVVSSPHPTQVHHVAA